MTNYFRLREYLYSLRADHTTLIALATREELNWFDRFQQTGLTGPSKLVWRVPANRFDRFQLTGLTGSTNFRPIVCLLFESGNRVDDVTNVPTHSYFNEIWNFHE